MKVNRSFNNADDNEFTTDRVGYFRSLWSDKKRYFTAEQLLEEYQIERRNHGMPPMTANDMETFIANTNIAHPKRRSKRQTVEDADES